MDRSRKFAAYQQVIHKPMKKSLPFSYKILILSEKVFCSKPEITEQSSVVKVLCSSGKCPKSGLMHTECFDKWEDLIVGFLAKQGSGRTWSDKQVLLIGAIITF